MAYNKLTLPKKFSFSALLVIALVFLTFVSCDDDDDPAGPSTNIVQLAQSNSNLSTLVTALGKFPDLVSTLGGTGEFTVFAPTNEAFANLLTTIGQTSLNDIPDDVLREVLEYHVIAGETVRSTDLTNGDVETVNGEAITVSITGGVKLNGTVNVTAADVAATNGIVHVVDAVLVPPSMVQFVNTVVEPAYFNKNFTTLIAAVKAASPSILATLLNSSKKTLFAPTNAAFEAAGITSLPAQSVLDAVLGYHVIASEVASSAIATGSSSATTLNGKIYLSKGASGVFINGTSKVTTADITASNGVVHVIDRTLLPPSKTIAAIVSDYANASSNKQFTQLLAALARTDGEGADDLLAAVTSSSSNLTVFAPTDAAFNSLYTALGVDNVNEIPLGTLIAVLKHHVVGARAFSSDLANGQVGTLNGNVTVSVSDNPPSVTGSSGSGNKANLQTTLLNIHATNGVIHVIDKVLIPD
ncbi:MAG TPA: fasciclin domain-containing protein [Chryseolinea sp.]